MESAGWYCNHSFRPFLAFEFSLPFLVLVRKYTDAAMPSRFDLYFISTIGKSLQF